MYKLDQLFEDLKGVIVAPTTIGDISQYEIIVELVGVDKLGEFEDGDLLSLDGDVGVSVDPHQQRILIKALSNEDSE